MTVGNYHNIPVIEAESFATISAIEHAFFTRQGGVSTGLYDSLNCGYGSDDSTENVRENRRRASTKLGVNSYSLVSVYQVHGTNVVTVQEPWDRHSAPKADGMVTRHSDLALGILTADCTPVLFADTKAGIIGACHAGWRGALDGIVEATVFSMEALGSARGNIQAAIGPCIGQKSYQVGIEFRNQFTDRDPQYSRYFIDDDATHLRFDLGGFVEFMLDRAQIMQCENVCIDNCAETEILFSYRRTTLAGDSDYGRGLSAIALKS